MVEENEDIIDHNSFLEENDIKLLETYLSTHNTANEQLSQKIILLLKQDNISHIIDQVGRTLLLRAAIGGHIKTVKWLLKEKKAVISERGQEGETALLCAAACGHIKIIKWLLDNGATVMERDCWGFTALLLAALGNHTKATQLLLRRGASIAETDHLGRTALLCAAMNGGLETVQWLLNCGGAKVIEKDKFGRTALLYAAMKGHLEIVRWLLKYTQASLAETSNDGRNILFSAILNGQLKMVKWLLDEYGINLLKVDAQKQHPLVAAAFTKHEVIVGYLIHYMLSQEEKTCNVFSSLIAIVNRTFAKRLSDDEIQCLYALKQKIEFTAYELSYYQRVQECTNLHQDHRQLRDSLRKLGSIDKYRLERDKIDIYFGNNIAKISLEIIEELHCLLQDITLPELVIYRPKERLKIPYLRVTTWMANMIYSELDTRPEQLIAVEILCDRIIRLKSKLLKDEKTFFIIIDSLDTLLKNYQEWCADFKFELLQPKICCYTKPCGYQVLDQAAVQMLAKPNATYNWQELIQNELYGGHKVVSYAGIHFKQDPYAPGIEFMVDSLNKLIAGQGSPPSTLLKIWEEDSQGEHKQSRVFLASKSVPGQNLQYLLSHQPQYLLKINPYNFSAMIISGLLINPQDGKPDNYMVQFSSKKQLDGSIVIDSVDIIGIDNDIAFSPPIIKRHTKNENDKHYPNIRNVLYFFPQMTSVIDKKFRRQFLERSAEEIVIDWLMALYKENQWYEDLLKKNIFTRQEFEILGLPIRLIPGTATELYRKLLTLRQLLLESEEITHQTLFYTLHRSLSVYYEYTSWRAWDCLKNKKQKLDILQEMSEHIQIAIQLLYEDAASFEDLEKLKNSNIKSLHMSSIVLKSAQQEESHKYRQQSIIEALSELVSVVNFGHLNICAQENLLNKIKVMPPLNTLNLHNCIALNSQSLQELIDNHLIDKNIKNHIERDKCQFHLKLTGYTKISSKLIKIFRGDIHYRGLHLDYQATIALPEEELNFLKDDNIGINRNEILNLRPKELTCNEYSYSGVKHIIYAELSYACYQDDGGKQEYCLPNGWVIDEIFDDKKNTGYFGVVYINKTLRQVIIASRGTDLSSLSMTYQTLIKADLQGVLLGNILRCQIVAINFILNSIYRHAREHCNYQYSLTGHSLGGWLSQIALYHATDWHLNTLHAPIEECFPEVRAIIFDSPGAMNMLMQLQPNIIGMKKIKLSHLNVINYVSHPNIINTCNQHVGLMYRIHVQISKKIKKITIANFLEFTLESHSMEKIISVFDKISGMPLEYQLVKDWPQLKLKPDYRGGVLDILIQLCVAQPLNQDQLKWNIPDHRQQLIVNANQSIYDSRENILSGVGELLGMMCRIISRKPDESELMIYTHFANSSVDFDPKPINFANQYQLSYHGHYQITEIPKEKLNTLVLGYKISKSLRQLMQFRESLLSNTRTLPQRWQSILRHCYYEKIGNQHYLVLRNSETSDTISPLELELLLRELWNNPIYEEFRKEVQEITEEGGVSHADLRKVITQMDERIDECLERIRLPLLSKFFDNSLQNMRLPLKLVKDQDVLEVKPQYQHDSLKTFDKTQEILEAKTNNLGL